MYSNKLIKFMELKAVLIISRINEKASIAGVDVAITSGNYFNKTDRDYMLEWPEIKAEKVWNSLVENIARKTNGLYDTTCPFCMYAEKDHEGKRICTKCTYRYSHGICGKRKSDYRTIMYYQVQISNYDYSKIINCIW